MAGQKSGDRADTGAGAKTQKRGVKRAESKLKDLDSKKAREIRGGALNAYLNLKGQKQGDIK
jgi:hypothetical protein